MGSGLAVPERLDNGTVGSPENFCGRNSTEL